MGDEAGARIAELAADVAVLGACGLEAGYGLSSDDFEEAKLKRAMADAAARTVVLTDKRSAAGHDIGPCRPARSTW